MMADDTPFAASHAATNSGHLPVMIAEVLAFLAPHERGIYVDGTFGGGGYSRALLAGGAGKVFGIDRDPEAVARGQALADEQPGRFVMLKGTFGRMDSLVRANGTDFVDGIALDLGVSSFQLDDPARGFSFAKDGPLDMRMSQGDGGDASAADLVNQVEEKELARIFREYGEERFARRIARAIIERRMQGPIARTGELAEIIRGAVPGGRRQKSSKAGKIDPATRSFQALRIAVNHEMEELDQGLAAAEELLRPGGRLAAVSFHSLEDRRVKSFLRRRSGDRPSPSRHLPPVPETLAERPGFRQLTRRAVKPGAAEIARNPRARSARLRAAERLAAASPGGGA